MLKKMNFILCMLLVLVFLFQMFVMFQDYFEYTEIPDAYDREKFGATEHQERVSLMEFMWTIWPENHDMPAQIIEKLTEAKELDRFHIDKTPQVQFETRSNKYMMGLVGTMALGLVVAVMTIFTRKSLVQYLFTLAWAACGMYAFFTKNYILQNMGIPSAGNLLLCLKISAIAAVVLTIARAYPWFYTRWIHKEKLDLEALNA